MSQNISGGREKIYIAKKKPQMARLRYLLILILLASFYPVVPAQKISENLKGFTAFVKYLEKKYNITDDEIIMTDKDSVFFYHSKNRENEGRNYLIGSCSKSFTALVINILADEGKVDLSRPVKDYLPWFNLSDSAKSTGVTVRNLLNQTSGIPSRYGFFDDNTDNPSEFRKKLVSYLSGIEQVSAPGERFI
jgi:hypothetical protein